MVGPCSYLLLPIKCLVGFEMMVTTDSRYLNAVAILLACRTIALWIPHETLHVYQDIDAFFALWRHNRLVFLLLAFSLRNNQSQSTILAGHQAGVHAILASHQDDYLPCML